MLENRRTFSFAQNSSKSLCVYLDIASEREAGFSINWPLLHVNASFYGYIKKGENAIVT